MDSFARRLRELKTQQEYNETLYGSCYNQKYKGYLFVNKMGDLILPNSVIDGFARLLAGNGLRKIRFHDLRHSSIKFDKFTAYYYFRDISLVFSL